MQVLQDRAVNRKQRRAARRAGVPADAITYAERYRCPDCSSVSALQVIDGVPVLDVSHDGSCPEFRRRSR